MDGLKVAKLVTGEVIIGRIIKDSIFTNVFKLIVTFDQTTGTPNITLVPYMHPVDKNLDYLISTNHAICISDVSEHLSQLYVQNITQILSEMQEKAKSEENSVKEDLEEKEEPEENHE